MNFLLDSCISNFAVRELRKAGFNVLWIPETGKDPGDDIILQQAFDEDLALVTADKCFCVQQASSGNNKAGRYSRNKSRQGVVKADRNTSR